MMVNEKPYAATYRDELALTRHFVALLEQRLAGRDMLRRTNVHPLDWCHLGVMGPVKIAPAPVQYDAEQVEAEASTDSSTTSAAAGPAAPSSPAPGAAAKGPKADTEAALDETRVVADKGDDRGGARRSPSAIGFEMLIEPDPSGFIELTVAASLCVFTKHLPTWKEQTSVLDTGLSAGAPLADVVQRWPLEVKDVTFRIPSANRDVYTDNGAVQAVLDAALEHAFGLPDAERQWPGTRPKLHQPDCLKDEASFAAFIGSVTHGLPVERWGMQACLEVRADPRLDGKVRVGCYLRNATPETPPLTKGKGLKDAFKVISDVCVNAVLHTGHLQPIEILPVPQDYQYDR